MNQIVDRLLLIVLAYLVVYLQFPYDQSIIYLLFGIGITAIFYYLQDAKQGIYEMLFILICILSSFLFPIWFPFSALAIYIVFERYVDNKRFTISSVMFEIIAFIYIVSLHQIKDYEIVFIVFLMVFPILAAVLGMRAREIELLEVKLKKLRDDNTEKNAMLIERNRFLSERQNQEIHIATLSERNRIAREIHDNVGHMLSRSILQIGAIMTVNKSTPVESQLEMVKNTLDGAMNSIRESVHDLHKESFDLEAAVNVILEDCKDYKVTLDYDIRGEADGNVKYAFITILKEAINNIHKHSNADSIIIIFRELEEFYQMVIEDNGSTDANISGIGAGIGLINMEDRVRALKGFITISNSKGFRIFISIPKEVR